MQFEDSSPQQSSERLDTIKKSASLSILELRPETAGVSGLEIV